MGSGAPTAASHPARASQTSILLPDFAVRGQGRVRRWRSGVRRSFMAIYSAPDRRLFAVCRSDQ